MDSLVKKRYMIKPISKLAFLLLCFIGANNVQAENSVEKIIAESTELTILKQHLLQDPHNRDELKHFKNVEVTVLGENVEIYYDDDGFLSRQFKTRASRLSVAPQRVILDDKGRLISIAFTNLRFHNLDYFKQFKQLRMLTLRGRAMVKDGFYEVSDLPSLEELYLGGLKLKKISIGHNLSKLRVFSIGWNDVNEIVNLNRLSELVHLDLEQNPLTEVTGIEQLKKLQWVDLSDTKITQLPNLTSFEELTYLDVISSEISKLEGLDKLKKITYLNVARTKAQLNIDKFPSSLEYLEMGVAKLTKMPDFSNLVNLKKLGLGNLGLKKIEGLGNLKNLEKLKLRSNPIKIIEGLDCLVNLKDLNLVKTNITKIEGLDKLINLEKLNLSETNITKIEGLDNLKNLKQLDFSETKIRKLEGLNKLSNLEYAKFFNADIAEVAPDAYDGLSKATVKLLRTPYYNNLKTTNKDLWRKLLKEKKL